MFCGPVVYGHNSSSLKFRLESVPPSHRERPKDSLEAATQPNASTARRTHEHRTWLIVYLPVNRASHRDAVDGSENTRRAENVKQTM